MQSLRQKGHYANYLDIFHGQAKPESSAVAAVTTNLHGDDDEEKMVTTQTSNSVVAIRKKYTVNLEKMERYQAVGFSSTISQPLMYSTTGLC